MRNGRITAGLAAALLAGSACAPAPAAAPYPAPTRATPPPPLAERPLQFPGFQEFTLDNGLRVLVVENAAQPIANLTLHVRAGESWTPARQAGLAGLTAEVLTRGTASRSANQISSLAEGMGGSISASAGADNLTISTSVLAEHAAGAFELLADVATRPTFPAAEVELARRRTLSSLQAALGQPGVVAQRQFAQRVYGEHPYGVAPIPGTVQGIQREDLARFHETQFRAGNALLVVSGAVTAAQVEALARQHFTVLPAGEPARPAFAAPPARDATRIYLVHRPGSVQSNILIGHTALRPDNQDFAAMQVANGIIGGSDDARLFQILREQRGWTYGAYSRVTRPQDIGHFVATAEVRTEVTDSALNEMLRQMRRLRDEPVTAGELRATQGFLAGSFPLRLETPAQIASQIAEVRLLGLPLESLTGYRERINAVTTADVQRVARQYIHPERAAVVVVGDAPRLMEMLDGIAPISLFDVEGRPLERAAFEVRAPTAAFDASSLRPMELEYVINVQGNAVGSATTRLVREGQEWVATSEMMGQQGEVRFRDDLTPLRSQQRVEQGPVSIAIELQLADGRVTGDARLPDQMGGDRTYDLEVVPGTLLPQMDSWVLATSHLEEGASITVPVFEAMSGSVQNVTYRVTGTESVTVPAGTFPALRVEVAGAQPMTLYVRQEAPHLLLRQEMAGQPVVIELREVRER
jgi:zinc protease